MNDSLGDEIAKLVYEEYDQLKASSKPVTRSNGTKEWTVLAAVVAINENADEKDLKLIAISTGVKAMPNARLDRSCGRILHDCHAEILALRGFNFVLLKNMQDLKNNETSSFLDKSAQGGKFRWKSKWKLALYVSRLPCGDASMDHLEDASELDIEMSEDDRLQYIDPGKSKILRGRMNFKRKGAVRTKPGRLDSDITLSKSCSDKLCIKQITSALNSLTWELMETPVYLKYLVIPELNDTDKKALIRCFHTRLCSSLDLISRFQFLTYQGSFTDDKTSDSQLPSATSFIKVFPSQEHTIEQAILNGVKNGFYTKLDKPLRRGCESILSRYSQWNLYKSLKSDVENGLSYLQFKAEQEQRRDLVENAKICLSHGSWIATLKDDCI
ncbi:hypothetical protein KAFR_0J02870 [Kazachstania africana CBS 2517]|uniref:A to I editase domain-containing protein n=1 Tax=Kazachstania africana (strain ATCC 22294 / BCRC 22015 / CBS 2517 / CECT 1963 / NBRC 1671 / NRRL Y-8276) TaxID=1071382 RepID=H2B151_KAZAF|nr:hypothetical protein KAFR_0J02870 [Kazachstania africana CBS 2517]CCF60351.1 hypothetical protein KAFR_0J02870 [Kazachstania africana CBS 2517]